MIQAKIYAPTLEHHKEALSLVGRSRATSALKKTAAVGALMFAYLWWRSDFAFPLLVRWIDLLVAVTLAAGGEVYSYFSRSGEAKMKAYTHKLDTDKHGPNHYRASIQSLDWWWLGFHERVQWGHFDRFKLTDELLIVAKSHTGEYWALLRADLGPDLVPAVVDVLRQAGAKEVAGRRLSPPSNQPT